MIAGTRDAAVVCRGEDVLGIFARSCINEVAPLGVPHVDVSPVLPGVGGLVEASCFAKKDCLVAGVGG